MSAKKAFLGIVLASLALLSPGANASYIHYSYGYSNSVPSGNFVSDWNGLGSVTSSTLSAFNNVVAPYAGSYTFSFLDISFAVSGGHAGQTMTFQLAPDAGYGAALYLDGNLLTSSTSDIWWGYDWNSGSGILSNKIGLTEGTHTLSAYWAEGCCNGGQSARYTVDGGQSFQTLSVTNLDSLSVPEPASLALLGLGLAGIGVVRRRQKGRTS